CISRTALPTPPTIRTSAIVSRDLPTNYGAMFTYAPGDCTIRKSSFHQNPHTDRLGC
ncbi:hypothetical protein J6590_107592, partial [Homalodisca vitripennis]